MSILLVLIPLSLALVVLAGWGFFWAVSTGQFDDLESPGWEILRNEVPPVIASSGDDDGQQ
jgi:cbb3-type cytochrome oxidase maturation protein